MLELKKASVPEPPVPLEAAYMELSRGWISWADSLEDAIAHVTEVVAEVVAVARVGIWRFDGDALVCVDLYNGATRGHEAGISLAQADYPEYFDALDRGRVIDATDARTDPRTRCFRVGYLDPLSIGAMLDATLRMTGRTWGVLCLEHVGGPRVWRDDERRFAVSVADLLAQMLVFDQTRRSEERLAELAAMQRAILDAARYAIISTGIDGTIQSFNPAAESMLGFTSEEVIGQRKLTTFLNRRLLAECARSLSREIGEPIAPGFEVLARRAMRANGCEGEWLYVRSDGSELPVHQSITPVTRPDGEVTGFLGVVADLRQRKETEAELAYSREELLRSNETLRLINAFGHKLQKVFGCREIARETIALLKTIADPPKVAVYGYQPGDEHLELLDSEGFVPEVVRGGATLPFEGSASGLALRERRPVVIRDLAHDRRVYEPHRQRLVAAGIRSAVVLPMLAQDKPEGCINLLFAAGVPFRAEELETLASVATTVALAISNARHIAALAHQATHDPLTGLPNRILLHTDIQAMRQGQVDDPRPNALLLLDLDRFKEVNDTLGHEIGDRVLNEIARRLTRPDAACRVYRLGGDEFAVVLPGIAGEVEIDRAVSCITARLSEPVTIGEISIQVDTSVGVAVQPHDGEDSHALLRCADVAMYEAKHTGSTMLRYRPEMDRHTPERLALVGDFRPALATSEILLHYQPKLDLRRGRIAGFEALVRWQHPRHGLLYPGAFISLVEHSELIHDLSIHVLQLAADQQRRWRSEGLRVPIAVNLSARNLLDQRCMGEIEALVAAGADLELEITETALAQDAVAAASVLRGLVERGVELAIDDFSMGHSSLGYLRLLPVTKLKIDRSFVSDMVRNEQDRLIVAATISLSHDLGLTVVAEGVEDAATVALLRSLGCDHFQGYFLSRPLPPEQVPGWLSQQRQQSG